MALEHDSDVPAWWRALGLPGLFDIHTHFLPERMERRVWHHFAHGGPLMGHGWKVTYQWPVEERVARLRDMGVRHFTALPYAHRPDMAADLNSWALDFARRTPECLPSATFYPEPSAPAYVRRALEAGARVFKVHLQVGGFDPRLPELDGIWGLLAEAGIPVVVHASSVPVPGGCVGVEPIGGVLRRHPRLRVVIAHLGMPEYAEFFDLALRYERVALDTTMAFTDFAELGMPFPQSLTPVLLDLGLAGKVVLGSDFPNIPHPYAHQLDALDRLGLADAWLRAVCWDNGVAMV
ncbi:amidohydrolase family protein [Thermoactinospora rubra]|uniref:amidohydrolase family protein n=1 Tax=Thermoactinospora rubra TaxID=1088767 RepID=UPI000A115103|nr:amidohydrolase family protein [Thermoactinospora rubra]